MKALAVALAGVLFSACATSTGREAPTPDREISVVMKDDFTYDPRVIEVRANEVILFRISNEGKVLHEFLIGTVQEHERHAKEMAKGHAGHQTALEGVMVRPGKTSSFSFAVPKKQKLIFACHEPGHYRSGMRGEIRYLP